MCAFEIHDVARVCVMNYSVALEMRISNGHERSLKCHEKINRKLVKIFII